MRLLNSLLFILLSTILVLNVPTLAQRTVKDYMSDGIKIHHEGDDFHHSQKGYAVRTYPGGARIGLFAPGRFVGVEKHFVGRRTGELVTDKKQGMFKGMVSSLGGLITFTGISKEEGEALEVFEGYGEVSEFFGLVKRTGLVLLNTDWIKLSPYNVITGPQAEQRAREAVHNAGIARRKAEEAEKRALASQSCARFPGTLEECNKMIPRDDL
jgi:hypothetical protein